jgi:hypothetical protein
VETLLPPVLGKENAPVSRAGVVFAVGTPHPSRVQRGANLCD